MTWQNKLNHRLTMHGDDDDEGDDDDVVMTTGDIVIETVGVLGMWW
jgi:hypothetical protein